MEDGRLKDDVKLADRLSRRMSLITDGERDVASMQTMAKIFIAKPETWRKHIIVGRHLPVEDASSHGDHW